MIKIIAKHGDDLRQDMLTIQMLTIMDKVGSNKNSESEFKSKTFLAMAGEWFGSASHPLWYYSNRA